MGAFFSAFVAEIAIVTYRAYKDGWTKAYPLPMPLPADYLATGIFFSVLALVNEAESLRPLPAAIGWAFVAATLIGAFDPTLSSYVTQGNTSGAGGSAIAGLFSQSASSGQQINEEV